MRCIGPSLAARGSGTCLVVPSGEAGSSPTGIAIVDY
jgi:hypothetical protein